MNNNLKNILYTSIGQVAVLGLALIVPRFILSEYGSDTNGLLSTVGQIVAYLSLLEAGIGQATRNELYQYVQGNDIDKKSITSVMTVSRSSYRNTTKIYALLVLVLAFLLPFVIKTELSYLTVFSVILIEGASGVISFYFVQIHTNLLMVDGRQYVNSNIDMVFRSAVYLVKLFMALIGVNIVIMECLFLLLTIVKVLIYERYMKVNYCWLDYRSCHDERVLKDRGPYMVTEIAWIVFSSTDMIVISIFCSTKSTSVYSVYYMIFLTINKLADALFSSLKFNLGQSYHKNSEEYKATHDLFNSVFVGAVSSLLVVAFHLAVPFVALYTEGITDADYIDNTLPMGFCLIFLLSWSRMVSEHLIGIAGFAKKLMKVSIIEVIINVTLSVILVNVFGMRGVVYATAVALPLKVIYCNLLADKMILKRNCLQTFKILAGNLLLFLLLAAFRFVIHIKIDTYGLFFMCGMLFTVCSVVIFVIANILLNKSVLSASKRIKTGVK